MKVLLVNTSYAAGGAAVAARRLMEALRQNGAEATMLVRDGNPPDTHHSSPTTLPFRWLAQGHFLWERLVLFARLVVET